MAKEKTTTVYDKFNIVTLNNGLQAYLLSPATLTVEITSPEADDGFPEVEVHVSGSPLPSLPTVNLRYGTPVMLTGSMLPNPDQSTERVTVGWLSRRGGGAVFTRIDVPTAALVLHDHEDEGIEFTVAYDVTGEIILDGQQIEATVLNIDNERRLVTLLLDETDANGDPEHIIVPRELVFTQNPMEDDEDEDDEDLEEDDED